MSTVILKEKQQEEEKEVKTEEINLPESPQRMNNERAESVFILRAETEKLPEQSFEPAEKRLALSDSNMLEKFGAVKTMMIYQYVKKFGLIVRKRLKNYKTKRMVVEEILKTEETFINGLSILQNWKDQSTSKNYLS